MLEVVESAAAWKPVGDDFEFSHTSIVFKDLSTGELHYSLSSKRYRIGENPNPNELGLIPIPLDDVWPLAVENELVEAPTPLPPGSYIKRPSLLGYEEYRDRYRPADLLLDEARICEMLKVSPHPNVTEYHGIVVENGRIVGLCFIKYPTRLTERVGDTLRLLNSQECLEGIKKGIEHLHGLGLIHNDINPFNVMLTDEDLPVIIDFDSCRKEGEDLRRKAGTENWADQSSKTAERENDYYGLRKISDYLLTNVKN